MVVVGSVALMAHGIDLGRKFNDVDFICYKSDWTKHVMATLKIPDTRLLKLEWKKNHCMFMFSQSGGTVTTIHEASILDDQEDYLGSDKWVYDFVKNCSEASASSLYTYAPPEIVFMMKMSHRFKKDSVHFHKTRQDIIKLRAFNVNLSSPYNLHKVLAEREKNTLPSGYKLKVNKAEFFTDNVPYKYDHDSLHEAVKHTDKPAYQYYMKDGEEVMCSKDKFFAVPKFTRQLGVLEETNVLALERAIIPYGTDPMRACEIALEKVCTSITKGWFREFAWENYDVVYSMINHVDLMDKLGLGLSNGTIKPYKQGA